MTKNLSAKYYQGNKERLQKQKKTKKSRKKRKSNNTVVSNTEMYQKMKNKNLLSIEKKITT